MGWIFAAAATASAFNLVCVGTQTSGPIEPVAKIEKKEQVAREYRVDLEANRWCVGSCEQSYPIAGVEPYRLYLDRDKSDDPISSYIAINREDGQIITRIKFGNSVTSMIGECRIAPFTGLPVRRF